MEKSTMCFAENQARCPWEPLHVALGYPAEDSIVIVVAARPGLDSVLAVMRACRPELVRQADG